MPCAAGEDTNRVMPVLQKIKIRSEGGDMTSENEHYYCEICGMAVRVVKGGGGTLVCCGQDMIRISEEDARKMAEQD